MSDLDQFITRDTRSPLRKALGASASGVGAVKLVEFPGCGGRLDGVPLGLRTLTAGESIRVRTEAHAYLTRQCSLSEDAVGYSDAGRSLMEFEVKLRTVALALVDPSTCAPVCANAKGEADPDEVRTLLESDEVAGLFELFVDWTNERSPLQSKTAEEVEKLVDSLGKGSVPSSSLNGYDSATVRSIARALVTRLRGLMSSRSWPTSPSNDETGSSANTSG